MRTSLQRLLVIVAIWGTIALRAESAPLSVRAAPAGHTYYVNSTLDQLDADPTDGACASTPGGVCTLRAAIMESNFAAGPNTILVPAGTYTLTRAGYDDGALVGDLDLAHGVTIQGAGSGATIIDGNGAVTGDRVFQVLPSAGAVTLNDLTIRGGNRDPGAGDPYGGGGLLMQSGNVLTLNHVIVEDNTATHGAGLELELNSHAQLELLESRVQHNNALSTGGGLLVDYLTLAQIGYSQIVSNTSAYGGGLRVDCAQVGLQNSAVSGNSASQSGGGFDADCTAGGLVSLVNSTVSGNSAGLDGGGFYSVGNSSSQLTLVNSTVSGNLAAELGGGLYVNGGNIKILNDTIASNQVFYHIAVQPGLGGGLYLTHTAGSGLAAPVLTGANSIIANNLRHSQKGPQAFDDCSSADTTGGLSYNLFRSMDNCILNLTQVGTIEGQDPLLGPLQDNGGDTLTQALLPGSPAIDAADPSGCIDTFGAALPRDQRGALRQDAQCDMGAYEVVPEADLAAGLSASPSPARVGAPLTYTIVMTNDGPVTSGAPQLSDSLPITAAVASVTPSQGSCSTSVVCTPGALAAGARLTVTLVVTPTAAGLLTNQVSALGSEFDPVSANNNASVAVPVVREVWLPLVRR